MGLTPEQQRAVEARGKLICVDAGAGSGKTRVLVQRILHLIEHDQVKLSQIAAITFTDKAAAEMKERLRKACREKAPADDSGKMSFWRAREREVDLSRISTIHTFCSGILRENALSLGIDPDFAVLTEPQSEVLRSEVVTSTLHQLLDDDDQHARRAAEEYGIHLLEEVLHELLTQRGLADRLIRPETTADQLAAAWAEQMPIVEDARLRICVRSRKLRYHLRLLHECGGHCSDATDKREQVRVTLLALLQQLLREHDAQTMRNIIAQILGMKATPGKAEKNWTSERAYELVKDCLNAVKSCLKAAETIDIDPGLESRAAEVTASIAHVYVQMAEALRKSKVEQNVLDFDDLIAKALEVLRNSAENNDSVCARTARGLRHLLIDEFQDTDSVQYEIARLLAQRDPGPDLFIVGDAKQSIYYFRGAEVSVFHAARIDSNAPLPMRGNFRTAPPILQFINSFFTSSDLLAQVESPFNPLEAQRDASPISRIEFLVPPSRTEKPGIEIYREEEACMIAASLATIDDGAFDVLDTATDAPRRARYGDAAILLRSLSNVHLYERALREAGIPYTLVAGAGFYERQEVIDFRNLLAYLVDPCDELTMAALLRGPIVGLSDDALVELAGGVGAPRGVLHGFSSSVPLMDAVQNGRLAAARNLVSTLDKERERPLAEFIQFAFEEVGLEGIVLRQFMGPQRVGNLRKVAALAETFSGARPPSLRAFVHYLDDMAAREIREGEAAADVDNRHSVTIMTIHKAKGLEFPLVYVADLGRDAKGGPGKNIAMHKDIGFAAKVIGPDGMLTAPAMHDGICEIQNDEEMAEQARILYVAMTRARDHLFLCGAPAKAGGNAWMSVFEEQYGVCDKSDGDRFHADGWEAVVRRAVPPRTFASATAVVQNAPDIERIQNRIRAAEETIRPRLTVPVTDVLRAIHDASTKRSSTAPRVDENVAAVSRRRGTLTHAFLERWDFQHAPDSALASVLRESSLDDEEAHKFTEGITRCAAQFLASDLGKTIAAAKRLDREVPFILALGGKIIRGTIDLLIDGATIVDYKTGKPGPNELAGYATQLQLYAAAVRDLAGTAVSSAYLVLLDVPDNFVHAVDVSPKAIGHALQSARAVLPSLERT
ncbi:MAG: UvrD-helicase domain-containing protein [Candidatus Hydrogenedentes bacterium]|nr:UvrD-helicase domain-containing protein [Candidatus Hydrogenedentota bacterium]